MHLKLKTYIFFIFSLGIFLTSTAQEENDTSYVQVSGIISNAANNQSVGFVHVINYKRGNASISKTNGLYTLIGKPGDPIVFSSIGYQKDTIYLPENTEKSFLTHDISLAKDTIMLKEVNIYPWANYEEFREAFKQLKVNDNKEAQYAQKNIERIIKSIETDLYATSDPGVGYKNTMNQIIDENATRGTAETISLLNPIAWAQFFEMLKNGGFDDDE